MSSASSDSSPAALSSRASIDDEPIAELDGPVLERAGRDRIEDQRPGAQRSPQRARHRLDRRAGRTEDAGVAVGIAVRQLREHRIELGQERRQLGRRAFRGRRTTATIPHIEFPV